MPIMTTPPVPPISSRRRGDRASHERAVPAARAQVLSYSMAMAMNIAPSSSICSGTWPAARSANWGSTAAKNTMDLGLVKPTTNPSRRIRRIVFLWAAASRDHHGPAVPDRLHAQVDQIRRARQLDDAEYRHRALDHRADAQRHGGDLGINPDLP